MKLRELPVFISRAAGSYRRQAVVTTADQTKSGVQKPQKMLIGPYIQFPEEWIFSQHGYEVVYGSATFYSQNSYTGEPGQIGMFADERTYMPERDRHIAEKLRIQMPRKVDLFDNSVNLPLVVKNSALERGLGINIVRDNDSLHYWREVVSQNPRWLIPMEFIDCPSDYYTSYRILVDAFGDIHSCSLLVSPQTKHGSNPNSIVSNVSQGGREIRLNGKTVRSERDRKILRAHQIDPNDPRASQQMLETSSLLGVEYRGIFPYFGIDFIQRAISMEELLLEVNAPPIVDPEDIGIDVPDGVERDLLRERASEEMLRRVASREIATPV